MDVNLANLNEQLKAKGFSLTQSRILVFEHLLKHGPLTMLDLLIGLDGKLDRASVYRNVKLFEDLGMVQRLSNGFKYSLELSDRLINHHHHLVCIGCGAIADIHENKLEEHIADIAKNQGFLPKAHQIEVRGYCRRCRA